MTQTQILDEDMTDPFPAKTTEELNEMLVACRITKEVLSREQLIYSKKADFSKFSDTELVALNNFVRESSRLLSIFTAGGKNFGSGQDKDAQRILKDMYEYIDPKVKELLLIDKVMETFNPIARQQYGREDKDQKIVLNPAKHPELTAFSHDIEEHAHRMATSQDSLLKIAAECEKVAAECRIVAKTRSSRQLERGKKLDIRDQVLHEVEDVVPMLRSHVLQIGVSKKINMDVKAGNESKMTKDHNKVISLFTEQEVQDAHKLVEATREKLMQEMLFRRAGVARRLKREEELEKKALEGGEFENRLSQQPAYQDVLALGKANADARNGKRGRLGTDDSAGLNSPRSRGKNLGKAGRSGKSKSPASKSKAVSKKKYLLPEEERALVEKAGAAGKGGAPITPRSQLLSPRSAPITPRSQTNTGKNEDASSAKDESETNSRKAPKAKSRPKAKGKSRPAAV